MAISATDMNATDMATDIEPVSSGGRRARFGWVAIPFAIALVSRIFSLFLLLQYQSSTLVLPRLGPFTSPLVAWDGQWYLHIASSGYHSAPLQSALLAGGHHDFAFYPGWPLLVKILSLNGLLPLDVIAVIAANTLFVLAAIIAYRLFVERFSARTAFWAIMLLAFSPVAYVFSMAYTESLFTLMVGLYFVNRYGRSAPLIAGLSTLVRISGLALGASALVMTVWGRVARLRGLLIVGAVGLAFAAWWIYIWRLTGAFNGWLEGSASWSRNEGINSILREGYHVPWHVVLWLGFVLLMIIGSLLLLRRHPDMAIFGLVAIAMSLIGAPASSMPRHALVALPAFAALSDRLGPRLSAALFVAFAIAEVFFVNFAFAPGVHNPP